MNNKGHKETDVELCEELLEIVAIVNIQMTSPDVIVIHRSTRGSLLELITLSGGLLSLYAGFSSLSLSEIAFWVVRSFNYCVSSKQEKLYKEHF